MKVSYEVSSKSVILTSFCLYQACLFKSSFNDLKLYLCFLGIISEVPCLFFVMMCIVWALAKESAMSKKQLEPPSLWLKYVKI